MTRTLLTLAVLATLLDAVAYVGLIVSGHAIERNPIWATASMWLALAAKGLLIVVLVALTAVIGSGARWPLLVATLAGLVGVLSTVGAAL